MKTTPTKLLLALTMCFGMTAVHAESNNQSNNQSDNQGKTSSVKKETVKTTNVAAADSCGAVVVATACGPVQVTTCSNNAGSSTAIDTAQKNKDAERSKHDSEDRGDGKDHTKRTHSNSDDKYSNRDSSKDDGDEDSSKPYGYRWEQKNDSGVKQRKVTICLREGGQKVSKDVDDDGHYQGHDQDATATLGACEDQDDKTGKHTDTKNKGRNVVSIYKDTVCGAPIAYQEHDVKKHHKETEHASNSDFSGSKHVSGKDDKDDKGNAIDTNKHRAGARWTHDADGNSSTTNDRQVKVTICHRMGNAEVTLDVDDDGYFHGHSKHPLDTEGRCADQSGGKYTDNQKPAIRLATEAACAPAAAASPSASPACAAAGGLAAVLTGLGGGSPGVTVTPILAGARPSRGGVKNMR